MTAAAPAKSSSDLQKRFRDILSKAAPYLMILPVVVYYILFWVRPVLKVIIDSFRSTAGSLTLQNYVMLFTDPDFLPALRKL